MKDTILLTGASGFLGTELASQLAGMPDLTVYALVRAADDEEAHHRLKAVWQHDRQLCEKIGESLIPVAGDFTETDLGLDRDRQKMLCENVSLVIHAGAQTGLQKSRKELIKTNYEGTKQVISFARKMKNLRRFVYISTAYVAGRKSGMVTEEEQPDSSFSSYYELSKAKAEKLVRTSGLPFSICRPGMLVGDSVSGWIRNFNTVYYIFKLMLNGDMKVLPVRADTKLNLVPGDYAAESVLKICFSEEAEGRCFHLTCPEKDAPKAGELVEYLRGWAKDKMNVSVPKPLFVPLAFLKDAGLRHNSRFEEKKKGYVNNLLSLMPYFFDDKTFDRTNTDRICGSYDLPWRAYIDRLLDFACRKNFMRQTGQTVFEQACVRRESSRYPIHYIDISEDGMKTVSGQEANRRIQKNLDALWAWGIRKGDRVALTGINSVDYMTLEQAIGLIGAVSVPIYYTSPAEETSLLLEKSGAKWFFIGDRRMMGQLDRLKTDARLVSFSAGEADGIREGVMSYSEFLAKAEGPAQKQYPDPEDLATIRYTSGTTGEPKGVTFTFRQLAWMGEVLTNLLTWEDRNRPLRYLSFLPLSHVVEGILASYAPYYLLSKVDYYYLNDFSKLTDALPKVRPTIFFSVPRFYEKVWEQVCANRIGKLWLGEKEGPRKEALGAVLRTAVLRKAGIDQCRQLIVGSAPVSEALLLNFRSLGIEVHNAYGQTEAPLITINRMGDNVIPTIGTPLPETRVSLEEDGELIVEGPQVTPGYYGLESASIHDGILHTGDLGVIHENGHITLFGRKKDFIVTAYGKNISITKLEEKLKDIPGVSEAVLIGEGRPYCTALLWLEGDAPDLDSRIAEMNAGLSHPEQIRKYTVIGKPLSIQAGELTPNLKVKRANVQEHLAEEIEEMYR